MDNSLVLSHMPRSFINSQAIVEFLKKQVEAPPPAVLAGALCRKGGDVRSIWETIHVARKMSELTWESLGKRRIFCVSFWSEHYPPALRLLDQPPWNLFFLGKLPDAHPTLAIVGSRRPDAYGVRLVSTLIPGLKARPLQIISGLAYGIDSLAHFYACESALPNFAVLGSGVDVLYPPEHSNLAARILDGGGGILSEFPPGTQPYPSNFPQRNRIVSGLADVVWIVQGTSRSGSLHTARHAIEQGKTVVACPGDVFNPLSEIPNRLIFEGADPILQSADLDLLLSRPTAATAH